MAPTNNDAPNTMKSGSLGMKLCVRPKPLLSQLTPTHITKNGTEKKGEEGIEDKGERSFSE